MPDSFFRLDGKVAIVTGGGQSIGEAICRRLAAAGAKVVVFDLSQANADKVAKSLNGMAAVGSVTNEADVQRIVKEVEAKLGSIDILVNNAGITGKAAKTWELDREVMVNVLDVNVVGPFLLCKAVIPGMMARNTGGSSTSPAWPARKAIRRWDPTPPARRRSSP